jgi:hypothetical protein
MGGKIGLGNPSTTFSMTLDMVMVLLLLFFVVVVVVAFQRR